MSNQPLLFNQIQDDREERAALLDETPVSVAVQVNCRSCNSLIQFQAQGGASVNAQCPLCRTTAQYSVPAAAAAAVPAPIGASTFINMKDQARSKVDRRRSPRCASGLSVLMVVSWFLLALMFAAACGLTALMGGIWSLSVAGSVILFFTLLIAEAVRRRGAEPGGACSWSLFFCGCSVLTLAAVISLLTFGLLQWFNSLDYPDMPAGIEQARHLCDVPGVCMHSILDPKLRHNCGENWWDSNFSNHIDSAPPNNDDRIIGPDGLTCYSVQDCYRIGDIDHENLKNCAWSCKTKASHSYLNHCDDDLDYFYVANALIFTYCGTGGLLAILLFALIPVVFCFASSLNNIERSKRQVELQ